ncbi:ATP-dependent DNA helicase RecG [Mediterraneibacter butyricigenes]|uniref:ATP-dependent DNA helicase RecG n=1 Tax=Mediterraneibacter butyricigenes TaxID=2316025 RepID=A0A391NXP8_9FIRM|nr:ATP-dependent DNA helicase RecG [Mediterraneibacter butyricigenes]GCA65677.1 ATP-dependent DNA helicase RecG [Mediterraneibacter butyricigenes]
MNEYTGIREIKGIGEKTERMFQKLNIRTVGDLIRYFPRGYDIYEEPVAVSELEEGMTAAVTGLLYGKVQVGGSPRMQVTTAYLKDLTGTLRIVWYRMTFLRNTLKSGGRITVRGKIIRKQNQLVMEHPELFVPAESYQKKLNTLQPVYPLTAGLTNNLMTKTMHQALEDLPLAQDILSKELKTEFGLEDYGAAIRGIHFPKDREEFFLARKRLVFEEFLIFTLALRKMKDQKERANNQYRMEVPEAVHRFEEALPYDLTNAQKKVWVQIQEDFQKHTVMSRLVQGDVGSGKTIVALLSLFTACLNGYQGAMMAPTEVLARQHYESVTEMVEKYGLGDSISPILLTGSMTAKEKRIAYEAICTGEANLVIGTHALIQEKVEYADLALVITDEQHRFGVRQRECFASKGKSPHILVMSATPIPRTLALILYGDLDISVIDELPSNRKPIKNCVVDTSYRQTAYRFMEKQIAEGRQCYVICPMVEESEGLEAENVTDYAKKLKEELASGIRVEYLHGKMKPAQKEEIMEKFAAHEIDVLVSTTVIEVGIDVPNSTVMMIENAERFGLAQLHQLRGRVGRGKHQSYCIFMSGSKSKETKKRLKILESSNDGFYIAGEDLKMRGPGDVFGIRQSGLMDFKLGDVYQDAELLKQASQAASEILKREENGEAEEKALFERVQNYIRECEIEKTL